MSAANAPIQQPAPHAERQLPLAWLLALIGLLAALQLSMALGRSINWDEFWFYTQVEQVARGEFIQPLQTLHTRLFFWLPATPGTEIDHILTARLFMWACSLITVGGIYWLAKSFSDRPTALLAAALYMAAGYVLQHSISFRVDPIVTALLTSALCVASRAKLSAVSIITLGALIGVAAMVTIKFALWAPAFAGIALWRWSEQDFKPSYVARWFAAGAVAALAFALLYLLHTAGNPANQASAAAEGTMSRSVSRLFGFLNSPHLAGHSKGILTALPFFLAAFVVPIIAWQSKLPAAKRGAILLLWLPVLTPAFYVNSLPYFYAFILPPVAVACAFSLPFFIERYGQAMIAAVIALSALGVWAVDPRGITQNQRDLLSTVHQIFPEPVPYFDCCGMISSFPKRNEFLTLYGVEKYLAAGEPVYVQALQAEPVPLILDNSGQFARVIEQRDETEFLPQDAAALQTTFIRFWGDIFVAGHQIEAGADRTWHVLVPGTYTVEGDLTINGKAHFDGDLVELNRGPVRLSNTGTKHAQLIWGRNLQRPAHSPVRQYWTPW